MDTFARLEKRFHLATACNDGDLALVMELLPANAQHEDSTVYGAMCRCLMMDGLEVFTYLLSQPGFNVNHTDDAGCSILLQACYAEKSPIQPLVLQDPRVDLYLQNHMGYGVYMICAVEHETSDTLHYLLDHNVPGIELVSCTQNSLLHQLAMYKVDIHLFHRVQRILGNINVQNDCRQTPLHSAVCTNDPAWVQQQLHIANIDSNAVDDYGNTPLTLAITSNTQQVARLQWEHPSVDIFAGSKPILHELCKQDFQAHHIIAFQQKVEETQIAAQS